MNKINIGANIDIKKTRTARLAGVFYFILAITGIFTFIIKERIISYGDPLVTAENISSTESLFMLSNISELIMATSWICIAIALYALFKKVRNNIAVLMLSFVLVGGVLIFVNVIFQIASVVVIKNVNGYLASFNVEQVQALAMLFLEISRICVFSNYIFMGLWMFPFAFLVIKSGYFPQILSKIWAILLLVGGIGYIIDFITYFLFPNISISVTEFAFGGDLLSIFLFLLLKIRNPATLNSLTATN